MPEGHQKEDFTLAGIAFTFPRSFFFPEKLKDSCDSARQWEALYSETVLAHLLQMRRLTKVFE